jgi:hypothetical protein
MSGYYNQVINEILAQFKAQGFMLAALDVKPWLIEVLMFLIPIFVVDIFKLFRINTTRDERNN